MSFLNLFEARFRLSDFGGRCFPGDFASFLMGMTLRLNPRRLLGVPPVIIHIIFGFSIFFPSSYWLAPFMESHWKTEYGCHEIPSYHPWPQVMHDDPCGGGLRIIHVAIWVVLLCQASVPRRVFTGHGMNVGWSKREKHGEDMDLWIAVNCPGLRIPEFLSWGLGWSGYVLIVKWLWSYVYLGKKLRKVIKVRTEITNADGFFRSTLK